MELSIRVLLAVAAVTGIVSAQHAGDIPPALVWDKLKGNCPRNLDWATLHGKVVVVSLSQDDVFPNDINDWKKAVQNFQGKQVQFIQVVGGSEFLLDQALQQTAYRGCVLFDTNLRNQTNFKLPRFSRTVVVDQSGFIVGYARGGGEVKDAVRSVLGNQPNSGLDETPPQPRPRDPAAGLDQASYGVRISPATAGELRSLGAGGPDRYISKNQPLKVIMVDLWNTPLARIAFSEKLADGNYDVTAYMPRAGHAVLLQFLREAVKRQFGFVVDTEERIEKMYMLTALPDRSPQLQPASYGEKWMCGGGEGSIIGTAQTMQDIAHAFEGLLNVPVIDDTGLKGKYNYSAMSKLSGVKSTLDLAHQLGLELTEGERPIEMLVVRKIQ